MLGVQVVKYHVLLDGATHPLKELAPAWPRDFLGDDVKPSFL